MRSVFFPRLVNGPFGDPALYVRIAHRGEALLFDCGDLHPLSPREMLKLRGVFLSHTHIDHVAGFDRLLRTYLGSDRPLSIYGPPGTAERIGHRLAGTTWNLTSGYPLELTVFEWGDPAGTVVLFRAAAAFAPEPQPPRPCPFGLLLETPAYRVRGLPLDHGGIVSLAFALEETLHVAIHSEALHRAGLVAGSWLGTFKDLLRRGDAGAVWLAAPGVDGGTIRRTVDDWCAAIAHTEPGMKVVYVTDVAPSAANAEKIVALAAGADLLAIEATFATADRALAEQRNHLTAGLSGDLGRRAGVARLVVFHHSPRYLDSPRRLHEEAAAAHRGNGVMGE